MKKLLLLLTIGFILPMYSASVLFINDSPFVLSATVLSATGEVMGRTTIQPQQQVQWQNSSLNTTGISQSPFTVIFYCQTGEVYGTISQITTGGLATASTSSGPKFCKPKDDKKGKEEQQKSPLQYQDTPINGDQWRKQERY